MISALPFVYLRHAVPRNWLWPRFVFRGLVAVVGDGLGDRNGAVDVTSPRSPCRRETGLWQLVSFLWCVL